MTVDISRHQEGTEQMADGTYRVRCMVCGKSVSSPLTQPVTVRAWVICPECIERHGVDGGAMRTGEPLVVRKISGEVK
jgi:hypothetical protein